MTHGSGAVDLTPRSSGAVDLFAKTWQRLDLQSAAHVLLRTDDSMWIGTANGLIRHRKNAPNEETLKGRMVRSIVSVAGVVYVLTWLDGVWRIEAEPVRLSGWEIAEVGVPILVTNTETQLYLLTAGGVWENGNSMRLLPPAPNFNSVATTALVAGSAVGEWWLGTMGGLFYGTLASQKWSYTNFTEPVLCLLRSADDVWIGGKKGLSRRPAAGSTPQLLWDQAAVLALTAAGQTLWLATTKGIYRLNLNAMMTPPILVAEATEALEGATVRALVADEHKLWAVTTAGWAGAYQGA